MSADATIRVSCAGCGQPAVLRFGVLPPTGWTEKIGDFVDGRWVPSQFRCPGCSGGGS